MREVFLPDLRNLSTIRLGGRAIALLELECPADLELLPDRLQTLGGQAFFMGRGSNIIFRDGDLPLVLVRVNLNEKIQICGEFEGKTLVRAQAGAPLRDLLRFCLKNGLSGLEGLTGIPGSVGGAVAMNAGSFGTETAAAIHALTVWDRGRILRLNHTDLLPEYRNLAFAGMDGRPLVLEAIFALTQASNNVIFRRMSLNFFEKKSRQPLTAWSVGCAFKNPRHGLAAGILLDEAGFRGKRLGGMAFSSKHANFLVNDGKGTTGAALDLLGEAAESVYKNTGIRLELEARVIP